VAQQEEYLMSFRSLANPANALSRGAIVLAASFALILGPVAASAQNSAPAQPAPAASAATTPPAAPKPDAVVAKVGDETITEADVGFAAEDLASQLAQVPAAQRKAFLVSVLIDMKLMAQAARKDNLDQTALFKMRKAYLEDRALRRAYFESKISSAVTQDAVKAAYDKMVADFKPQDEVRASHILVKTEAEAQQVEKDLAAGKDFAELAKAKSIDPGAKNGGDLGYFTHGQMVKAFEDAAFSLKVGEISQPVQTQFGWHVIKVVDKKKTAPPTLQQVESKLQQQVLYQTFDTVVGQLKANVQIDIPDAALAAEVAKQGASGN
jgi:peptidyl-prolyl cis-trans isomerase C